ncbi:hypothetical protein WOLCODRAFT_163876 [Wolfiporia cocos MD-104 SS10]|uniref:Aminotransferase class I/classII domain-containing protein n=1 Tax=Wolfiporia cocos (strain MD-104) TaxID=742152 RepID=A0A2H3JM08_WOLCO|nr:hypothetical protein WOLCODRAFT_163876 [Wolfiporia cocos MD-104 SS10]
MTSLDTKLSDARLIRHRLPNPNADVGQAAFSTNDYLGLARSPILRSCFLAKLVDGPDVLGSGGSHLLPADAVVFDEHIHASVHDDMRASRRSPGLLRPFSHNSVQALREELIVEHPGMRTAKMVEIIEELFPAGNGHVAVDETHATGLYGRGLVALLGFERRVLARLHTFGKALAGTGGARHVPTLLLVLTYRQPYFKPHRSYATIS